LVNSFLVFVIKTYQKIANKQKLKIFNLKILKRSNYNELIAENDKLKFDLLFTKHFPKTAVEILRYLPISRSQLRQDLFVLSQLNFKKKGFFVEFGAADGFKLSNTYILEKNFKWKGIVSEPAKIFHKKLNLNRHCIIEKKIIWKVSNQNLQFKETSIPDLSTISKFSNSDNWSKRRGKKYKQYNLNTISLIDLLKKYKAPKIIDYLSIDTEGSEFEILKNFNFSMFTFKIITCEHNFTKNRQKIFNLLTQKGYVRKFKNLSQFDDWYINSKFDIN